MGDFVARPGRSVMLGDGSLLGSDKEQALRFGPDPNSHRISRTHNPNPEAPIYDALFDTFAKGKLDLNPNDGLPAIQRVKVVPDEAYLVMAERAEAEIPARPPGNPRVWCILATVHLCTFLAALWLSLKDRRALPIDEVM